MGWPSVRVAIILSVRAAMSFAALYPVLVCLHLQQARLHGSPHPAGSFTCGVAMPGTTGGNCTWPKLTAMVSTSSHALLRWWRLSTWTPFSRWVWADALNLNVLTLMVTLRRVVQMRNVPVGVYMQALVRQGF